MLNGMTPQHLQMLLALLHFTLIKAKYILQGYFDPHFDYVKDENSKYCTSVTALLMIQGTSRGFQLFKYNSPTINFR